MDEGLSGTRLQKLLADAGITAIEYETLLTKNQRTPDDSVLAMASRLNYVVITRDKAMDRDELESIVAHKAKIVILTDKTGGVPHFAAALIVANEKIKRALLDTPVGPLVIRLNHDGTISKIRGAEELISRAKKFVSGRIARGKRIEAKHQKIGAPARTLGLTNTT